MTDSSLASGLAVVRSAVARRAPDLPLLPGSEMVTVVLGEEEHRLALSIAPNGYGAACSCGQWEAAQYGSSRWILERIAGSWQEHLHRSDPSGRGLPHA